MSVRRQERFNPNCLPGLFSWHDASREATISREAGMAAQFTAANSESLSIVDNASLSLGDVDFTIAGWIYLDSLGVNQNLFNRYGGSNWEFDINVITSNYVQFSYHAGGTTNSVLNSSPFGALSANTWYWVLCQYDSVNDTMKIEINNTLANTRTSVAGAIDTNSPFRIGALASAQYFNGRQQCVGYWKRLLTSDEKTALYNEGTPLSYAELPPAVRSSAIAYWELNEPSGTRMDLSGNGNNLTDNNTVTTNPGTCLNAVGTWMDLSGKGRHAVQATQSKKPVFRANRIGGKPVVMFDGVDDYMTVDPSVGPTAPFSIFIVGKLTTATATFKNVIGMSQDTAVKNWLYGFSNADTNTRFWVLNVSGITSQAAVFTNPQIILTQINTSTATGLSEIRISGNPQAGTQGAVTSDAIFLGARVVSGTFQLWADFEFSEVIIYNRLLNSLENRRIEFYLARKWGVPVT